MKYLITSVGVLALAAGCGDSGQLPDGAEPPEPELTENATAGQVADGVDQTPEATNVPETPRSVAALAGAAADQLTIARATGLPSLEVTSSTFAAGEAIPLANSAYGDNRSPQISWSKGPEGTQSYVLIMEDPDLPGRPPFLHWIIGDLPASTTSLEAGMPEAPVGAFQTGVRDNSYFGPRPPSGVHNYTFQVFALDSMLDLEDGTKLEVVQGKMEGHMLAAGALQGTYTAPEPTDPPPSDSN